MEIIIILLVLVLVAFVIAANWKVFVKMDEPGWKSIIPFYSTYVLYSRVWNSNVALAALICMVVSMFLAPVGIASLVLNIVASHKEARAFGRGMGTTLGLIFLPFIFIPILGFGDARYYGPAN